MELYFDTVNIAKVKHLARIFPFISGVTNNPSIISAGDRSIWNLLPELAQGMRRRGSTSGCT